MTNSTSRGSSTVTGAPHPWMTWLLTGSILAVWIAQLIGMSHGVDRVGNALAFSPESFARYRPWTLVSYAWAHAVPMRSIPAYAGFHLVTNIVPFFCVAPIVERRGGPWILLLLFVVGAAGSALAWDAWRPQRGDAMIGASGALFAVIAAGGVWSLWLDRADLILIRLPLRLNLRTAAVVLGLVEGAQVLFHQMPDVAHVAHLGGGLTGALIAVLFWRAH